MRMFACCWLTQLTCMCLFIVVFFVLCNINGRNLLFWNQVYDDDYDNVYDCYLIFSQFTCMLVFLKRSLSSSMLPCSSSSSSSSWVIRASSLLFSSSRDDLTHTGLFKSLILTPVYWFTLFKLSPKTKQKTLTPSPGFIKDIRFCTWSSKTWSSLLIIIIF